MAVSEFLRSLSDPNVQRELAALSYAYGPQPVNNGVAARFAAYTDYKDQMMNQAIEQRMAMAAIALDQKKAEAAAAKIEETERKNRLMDDAKAKFEEEMRAAQLTSSMPSGQADATGAGPNYSATIDPGSTYGPMYRYLTRIGDYKGAAQMLKQQQEYQAAQANEQMIQAALADPEIRAKLGPAAEIMLRGGGRGLASALYPKPAGGAGAGAGVGGGGFDLGGSGRAKALEFMNAMYPKIQAGAATPDELREYNLARQFYNDQMMVPDPVTGLRGSVVDAGGYFGQQAAAPSGQPPVAPVMPQQQTGDVPRQEQPTGADQPSAYGPTLIDMAGDVSGPVAKAVGAITRKPIIGDMLSAPNTQVAQDYAQQLQKELSFVLTRNPKFPESQRKLMEATVGNLTGGWLTRPEAYKTQLYTIGRTLYEQSANARRVANDESMPAETRRSATNIANELPQILERMGIYLVTSEEEADRAPEGSMLIVPDSKMPLIKRTRK